MLSQPSPDEFSDYPGSSAPTCRSQMLRYQREAARLLLENEQQRREIVLLRRDLASALTQHVRAGIVVRRIRETQAIADPTNTRDLPSALVESELKHCLLDLEIAIDNWSEISFGAPSEVLDRVDALNRPIPEEP